MWQIIKQNLVFPKTFPRLPKDWTPLWTAVDSTSVDENIKLFRTRWVKSKYLENPEGIKKILILVHGFGEHLGRYEHFTHYLSSQFDLITGYDQRGHGRSGGSRGDASSFTAMVDDLRVFVEGIRAEFPQAELTLFGHSFGGLVSLRLCQSWLNIPVKQVILCAPFLKLKLDVNPLKKALAHTLSRVWGNLSLSSAFDHTILSRDESALEACREDQLFHSKMTPRMYVSLSAAQEEVVKSPVFPDLPLKLIVPTDDQLVDEAYNLEVFTRLSLSHLEVFKLEGYKHEPMNDTGKEKFFEYLQKVL